MIPLRIATGRVLRALRRERGLSLRTLEARSGISRGLLSGWERHGADVTLSTLVSVCVGLCVAPGIFVSMATATVSRPRLAGGPDRELIPAKPGVPALRMKIVRAPKPLPLRRAQR